MPALVDLVAGEGFTLRRVMFNPKDWDAQPDRRTTVAGQVVKLGAFNYQQRGSVTVVDDNGRIRITFHLKTAGG